MAATVKIQIVAVGFVAALAFTGAAFAQWDGTLTPAARQKLTQFEAHALNRAEDAWNKRQYRQAGVEYAAFAHEFPASKGAPYAMFRSARCLHLQEKSADAAKVYDEVVSAYPTNIPFASPALYFKGMCEIETGEPSKALVTWTELIDDPDYKRHPLAAEALQRVTDYYCSLNENSRALLLTEKMAVEYRSIHRDAAGRAMQVMIKQYVRNSPDVKKVQELYRKCGGFENEPQKVPDDLSKDWPFWTKVAALVRENGNFPADWIGPRRDYHAYWAGIFEPLLAEKEGFRLDVVNWYMAADKYEEARKTALQGERTPEKLFKGAEALLKLKRPDDAVALYDEIDKGGSKDAATAAYAAAMVHKDLGNVEKMKARLQDFVQRYPQSPDASKAKSELELFGIKK